MKKEKLISITKEEKYGKNHVRNKVLVNLITFVRSLGTIAIVPIYALCGTFTTALAVAGFFATDFIDGQLARRLHVESFFGSLLDGLSDKAFGIICLLLLSTLNPIFLGVIAAEIGILAINYKSIERGNNAKSSIAGKVKTVLLAASIVGSFFAYSAPTLKEILNYVNITSLNTLLEQNPNIVSTILATTTLGASMFVAGDYVKKAKEQDKERDRVESLSNQVTAKLDFAMEDETPNSETKITLDEIQKRRTELMRQKEEVKKLKSLDEIVRDLFDTDFYLEHRDDGIKKLFYKKGSE